MTPRRIVLLVAVFAAAVVAFAARPPATSGATNPAMARATDVVSAADGAGAGVIAAVTPVQRDGSSPQRGLSLLVVVGAATGAVGTRLWSALRNHGRPMGGRSARGSGAIRAPPATLAQLTLS